MPPRTKEIIRPARRILRAKPRRIFQPPSRPGKRRYNADTVATDAPGPPDRTATLAEWYVFWWLTVKRRLIEGIDFEFQSSIFGGRQQYGGLIIDFFFPNIFQGLVINVNGEYWHRYTSEQRAKDLDNKNRLEGAPHYFTVAGVLEDDVLNLGRIDLIMRNALEGQTMYPENSA